MRAIESLSHIAIVVEHGLRLAQFLHDKRAGGARPRTIGVQAALVRALSLDLLAHKPRLTLHRIVFAGRSQTLEEEMVAHGAQHAHDEHRHVRNRRKRAYDQRHVDERHQDQLA